MRWINRLRTPFRRRERGAVAVIVTIIVTFGVVIGMLAISAGIGSIMYQRRTVQNASDATAMALADACANGDPTICSTANAKTALADLANANSTSSVVTSVCASSAAKAAGVPIDDLCGAGNTSDLGACLPVTTTASAYSYVEVRTLNAASTPFGQALGSSATKPVPACARAAWGPGGPTSIAVMPLAISECDWANQVGYPGSTTYPASPSGTWPGYSNSDARPDWPSSEDTIYAKGNDTTCDTSSPGGTAPGGFAWLDGFVGPCSGVVADSSWVHGDTGANGCDSALFNPLRGTQVYVPVFDCMMASNPGREPIAGDDCRSGSGSNTYYHISGFAAFYVSGWRLTSASQVSIRPPNTLCGTSSSQRCLSGWFLKDLVSSGQIVPSTTTNPNYGITVVNPAG